MTNFDAPVAACAETLPAVSSVAVPVVYGVQSEIQKLSLFWLPVIHGAVPVPPTSRAPSGARPSVPFVSPGAGRHCSSTYGDSDDAEPVTAYAAIGTDIVRPPPVTFAISDAVGVAEGSMEHAGFAGAAIGT